MGNAEATGKVLGGVSFCSQRRRQGSAPSATSPGQSAQPGYRAVGGQRGPCGSPVAGPSPRTETHPPLVPTGRTRSRWPGRQARPSGGRLTQPPSNAAEPGRPAPPPPRLSSGRPRRPRIPAPGARGGSTRARRRAPGRPGRARLPGLRARRAPPRSRLQVRRGVRPPVTAPHGDKPALRCPGSAAAREASPRGGLAALRSRVRERLAFPLGAALRGSHSAQALDCAAWIVLPRVGVGKETRAGKSSEGCTCFWDLTRPGDNPVHQTGPHPYPPAPDRMQPWRVPGTECFFFFFFPSVEVMTWSPVLPRTLLVTHFRRQPC